jgi:hypothetical protein
VHNYPGYLRKVSYALPIIVSAQVRELFSPLRSQDKVDSRYDLLLVCLSSRLAFAKSLCMLTRCYLWGLIEGFVLVERDLLFERSSDVGIR